MRLMRSLHAVTATLALVALGGLGTPVLAQPTSPTDSLPVGLPFTLEQALARALQNRPLTDVASASVDRARGAARLVRLVPNPNVVAQVDERTPTHQLTLNQPLGWILRRPADLATGRALVGRAQADSAQLVADLGRDVQRSFYGALAAQERQRLVGEQAQLADSLRNLAERRLAAGDISELERDQIAQEARRVQLAAALAREQARVARAVFARAVAWSQDVAPVAAGELSNGLAALDALSAIDPDAVLLSLPTVQSALADSAAAAGRLRSLRWAQVPVPSLIAGVEWGVPAGAPIVGNESQRTSILGLSVPFPIWNQGREAAAEGAGAAREGAARAAEVRLTVGAALEAAIIRTAESAGRARFARDTLFPEASRIRAGAVRLYEAGQTGLLPVIDALRVERDAAQSLVQELLGFQEARADLTALLGRWP